MRSTRGALLGLAAVALAALPAHAGDVTRLQIELPPDIRAVEPGQRLDIVQVVGIDDAGKRVGFGGLEPTLSASAGSVESVEPPYRFAFTAPARIDGPLSVTFDARLPGSPRVRGSLVLEIVPPGRYVRLRVEADAERLDWADTLEFQVRGETRDGRIVPIADRRIDVVADGPGIVTFLRLGHYRLVAPATPDAAGRTEVALRARTAEDAAVHGTLSVALGPPVPGGRDTPPRRREEDGAKPTGGDGPVVPDAPDAAETPAADADETKRAPRSVLWPGGRLRLTAWRVRDPKADDAKGRRVRRLPESGGSFVAREPVQRLRLVIEDDTVRGVTASARHGGNGDGEEGEVADDAVDVTVKRNKAGKLTIVLEARPRRDGTALRVVLLLTRESGDPSREVFVLGRRRATPVDEVR
jgi:hypothetical protein